VDKHADGSWMVWERLRRQLERIEQQCVCMRAEVQVFSVALIVAAWTHGMQGSPCFCLRGASSTSEFQALFHSSIFQAQAHTSAIPSSTTQSHVPMAASGHTCHTYCTCKSPPGHTTTTAYVRSRLALHNMIPSSHCQAP